MAYEQKPNTFSLFKNEDKKSETHPDYKGSFVDDQGREYFCDAWIKKGQNNRTFMSGRVKLKDKQKGSARVDDVRPGTTGGELAKDSIPF
jgi:hypothetical protein